MANSDTDVDDVDHAAVTLSPRLKRRSVATQKVAAGSHSPLEDQSGSGDFRNVEDDDEDSDFVPETPSAQLTPGERPRSTGQDPQPASAQTRGQAWRNLPPTPLLSQTKARYGARKVVSSEQTENIRGPKRGQASFGNSIEGYRFNGSNGKGDTSSSNAPPAIPYKTPKLKPGEGYSIASKRPRFPSVDELSTASAAISSARDYWAPWTSENTSIPRHTTAPATVPAPVRSDSSLDAVLARLTARFPSVNLAALRMILESVSGDYDKAKTLILESIAKGAGADGSAPKRRRLVKKKDAQQREASVVSNASEAQVTSVRPAPKPRAPSRTITIADSSDNTDVDDAKPYRESDLDQRTVAFFNTASPQQMSEAIAMCTPEQGNFIVGLRPFTSMEHLTDSLTGHKGQRPLSKLPERYQEVLEGYSEVDSLIEQCEKFGDEVMAILKSWTTTGASTGGTQEEAATEVSLVHVNDSALGSDDGLEEEGDLDIGRGNVHKCLARQPSVVNPDLPLKSYQLVGISWLYMLHSKGLGGILADEMGLGKTAQVISFLGYLKALGKPAGPHLIVVPASTLENWRREITKWCPSLNVTSYYGGQSERFSMQQEISDDIDQTDIILTTYNLCTGAKDDRSFLRRLRCKSLILDEGHMVKNMESARYKHLMSFKASFRLLLTGTPLQNNLMELLALLTFIMPTLFSNIDAFTKIFNIKNSGETGFLSRQRIERAQKIMAPFVLRRKKAQVLTELPGKTQEVQLCKATARQRELYESIIAESRKSLLEASAASATADASNSTMNGSKPKRGKKKAPPPAEGTRKGLSNVLMQLRKAADHPLLFRRYYTDDKLWLMSQQIMRELEYVDANRQYIYEDMMVMSDFELHRLCVKFSAISKHRLQPEHWMDCGKIEVLKPMILKMRESGDRILLFSQFVMMLDILEAVLDTMGVRYLRLDGSTGVNERQNIIDSYNDTPEVTVFLLSTKAGGFGINLTSANVVVIYDLDFNPHNDAQAEDRAHRVGQTRDVRVVKLVLDKSVEQHILKRAMTKLKLDERVQAVDDDGKVGDDEIVDSYVLDMLRDELVTS
ncbi:hypothetical protein PhCBS80983_g05482 [Powellomyces hirtus]|uniref:DNA helicase n=1 Tax=Powellomyces hirtus TaxID=109895 RepID=A0A507DWB1_9FUNG|nr:hypothetical protein PhCBS80983_g05482 [Powellomyces hirtus]